MNLTLANVLLLAGLGQLSVLVASALVPIRLRWQTELAVLPKLHRQMYWTYGGYVVLAIVGLGLISVLNSRELAAGSGLARSFCAFAAVFWGIRLSLQAVFDVREHLTAWWLWAGEVLLTFLFASFTVVYIWAALH
ncbi:MAG: hypothetical protein SFU86_15675 [Pirellulaceae bacterium]|nr:hypothetical protein [Pirellulaceae bacterium]